MKKISILAISLTALLSCSNDDTQKTCDCNITIATYNEAMQAYEPISETHYSNNCSDYSPHYNPVGDGTYYSIDCQSK